MLACHVVNLMLRWLCMSFCSALFCNAAGPQCGWAGVMPNMCVGWCGKLKLLIACLTPLLMRRIVLRINVEPGDVSKCWECCY